MSKTISITIKDGMPITCDIEIKSAKVYYTGGGIWCADGEVLVSQNDDAPCTRFEPSIYHFYGAVTGSFDMFDEDPTDGDEYGSSKDTSLSWCREHHICNPSGELDNLLAWVEVLEFLGLDDYDNRILYNDCLEFVAECEG